MALGRNRTVLVIAHRLSTIKHADQIVVMDAGRVIECGAHEELLRDPDSTYARMWAMQSSSASGANSVKFGSTGSMASLRSVSPVPQPAANISMGPARQRVLTARRCVTLSLRTALVLIVAAAAPVLKSEGKLCSLVCMSMEVCMSLFL